ncbi:MAG: indolepyruvate oxidoreductase subunit beta [Treponema sp.]|nr:indolepyruvate oxidoreductase subunit beta [Treponema sp.]
MIFNLMIAGVGGQGTVLASKLISAAALKKGYDVRTTETIGMAQRGGSVFGHVRIGENIFSPLIPLGKANVIIAFEPAEAVRQLPYLCKDGAVLTSNKIIPPAGANRSAGNYESQAMIEFLGKNVSRLIVLDGERLTEKNAKTLNVSLLGAAAQSGLLPFDTEIFLSVFTEILPSKFLTMNIEAYELGRELCK